MPPKNFYNLPPSWNPGFEIPQSVMDEPIARGAFVTAQLPRGTISQVPHDLDASYDPHFDVPEYIKKEPYGQGAATTAWLPRGSIFGPVAEFGMSAGREILDRPDAGLSDDGLEDLDDGTRPTRDPIAAYGQDAASWLMHSIQRVPTAQRAAALRAVFDAIDPTLSGAVAKQAAGLKRRGVAAKPALQQAIATSMSKGMLKEVIGVGQRARRSGSSSTKGHVALGSVPGARRRAQRAALQSLGSWYNPVDWVKSAASNVADVATTVGSAIKSGASATGGFVKDAVNVVGDLACDTVSSTIGKVGIAAGASVFGGPAAGAGAAAGAEALASQCGGGAAAAAAATAAAANAAAAQAAAARAQPRGLPAWVGPAVFGVGILGVGALLIRRK